MANTYTKTLTNPTLAEAGSRSTLALFGGYANTINGAHAHGGCSHLISQSYPDNVAHIQGHSSSITRSGMGAPAFNWRVPVIDNKRTIRVLFVVERTESPFNGAASSPEIIVEFVTAGLEKTIDISNQAVTAYETEVALGITSEYEEIKVWFNCAAGLSFKIHTISMWYKTLSSPIHTGYAIQPNDASGTVRRFAGIGETQMTAGKPASSVIGKNLIDAVKAIDQRQETVHCWSGCMFTANSNTLNGKGNYWLDESTPSLSRNRKGDFKFVFHVRATNTTSDDLDLVLAVTDAANLGAPWPAGHNGERDRREYTHTLTIPAGTGPAWYTHTTPLLRFASMIGPSNPDRAIQAGIMKSTIATGRNSTTNSTIHAASGVTAVVNSISIWAKP